MFTLEAAKTLAGVAGSAATVTYTVSGDEVGASADTFKILAQGQIAGAAATIYTTPASTSTLVKSITLVNTSGSTVTAQLFVGGTAAANAITVNMTLPANGWATYDDDGWRVYDNQARLLTVAAGQGIGAISNSETGYSSGTVNLSGLGAITVRSTTGQAFQLSVNSQTAQTGISGVSNSNTTYTSGTIGLSELGAITIRSTTGNQFQFSVNSQTVQVETQTFVGALKNTETTYTSGTIELEGTNNVTVFSTTGQRFRISGANTHAQQTGISAVSNSNTTYTSGTIGLSELGAITIRSTTGNQFQFSVNSQTVQAETQTFVGAIKNTETTYTSGTIELEGTNNVTVFSTTGQRFRISGANTHAQQTGISGIQNSETTYTSGTVNLSVVGGAMTIRSTTGNAFQFSVGAAAAAVAGISNSETTYTSGTVGLSVVGGAMTIRSTTGNAFQFSVSQSVQAETQTFIGGISNSETNYTSGTVKISALGDMTLRSTTGNAFQFSVRDQTAITATTVSSVSNANAVGANNSRFALEAHIHEGVRRIGISTQGNTSGTTAIFAASQFQLVGTGDITLSQNTDAASNLTLTISVPAQTIRTATTVSSVSNANAVGANNSRFALEAHIHQGMMAHGVSNLGNTAGSTKTLPGIHVLVGTNGAILSQSSDANSGATISIDPGPNLASFVNVTQVNQSYDLTGSFGTPALFPLTPNTPFPGNITANTVHMRMSQSGSTATMSAANTTTFYLGIYTLNGSTLSLLNSVTTTWGNVASTNNSTSTVGLRVMSIHSSLWSVAPSFSRTHYWFLTNLRTSGVSNQTVQQYMGGGIQTASGSHSGTMGVATVNATSLGAYPWYGFYTASSTGMPASIGSNELNKQVGPNPFIIPQIQLIQSGPQTF